MEQSWTKRVVVLRKILQESLPAESLRAFEALVRGELPYFFMRDLPQVADPGQRARHARAVAEGALGLMYLRPVSYRSEYDGELVHDIMPKPGKENQASSSGLAPLPMHTDMAFLRFPAESLHPILAAAPDFLVLVGVVNVHHIKTRIVTLAQILERLEDRHVQALCTPSFDIASPESVNPRRVCEGVPIIHRHSEYGTMIRYNDASGKVVPRNDAGAAALSKLETIARSTDLGEQFDIQPGSLLIFNNRQVIHGRAAIAPRKKSGAGSDRHGETSRHFIRIYGQRMETETNPVFPTNPFVQAV